MKRNHFFTFLLSLLVFGGALQAQNCDPWIQNAYQKLFKRAPTAQECNIRNYNNGSWRSESELLGYVAKYNHLGDPWIFQIYSELRNRIPDATELNIRNYNNGSWGTYNELRGYVASYLYNITKERVQSSYVLAFGRLPNNSELEYWLNRDTDKSLSDRVENHRQFATNDKGTRRTLIVKSYVDVLGRKPTEDEINYWMPRNELYYQLTRNHLQWLGSNPAEFEKVIRRSYKAVFNRDPDASEVNYWKNQNAISYAVLLSCHEDWKSKNGQAARKMSGTSSVSTSGNYIQFASVSGKVANEANNLIGAAGTNVIAPGGGNVVAPGGANLIFSGGPGVVAPGGLN